MKLNKTPSAIGLLVLVTLLLAMVPLPLLAQESQGGSEPSAEAQQGGGGETTRTETTIWYANPVWIGAGAVLLILLILLVVMVSRSGDRTTVIRS
jgi:hypothetical protein